MTATSGSPRSHPTPPSPLSPPPPAGLLLAAGGGRRLGGRPKALLDFRGRPLVEHAARALREGGCAPVRVVLGAAADEVRARARLSTYDVSVNPRWDTGMGGSLRLGLDALTHASPRVRAVVVSLVDQPGIGAEAVSRLVAAYAAYVSHTSYATNASHTANTANTTNTADEKRRREVAGAGPGAGPGSDALIAAAYDGRRGHPVLFGAARWAAIGASAEGDRGARAYLKAHEEEIALVECSDVARAHDIDTPDDLAHLE